MAWDESADPHEYAGLLHGALELIREEFGKRTWTAFWRLTIQGDSSDEIAKDLGMTANAVRQAKFRVLQRLCDELGELFD